jgi:hypothetical protein
VPRALFAGCIACTACTAVHDDLLGPTASPCALGAPGVADDIAPPQVTSIGGMGVMDIVIDPFDRSVLYASTNQQGVWRTADCGASWTHANTGINAPMIENSIPLGIAIDPFVPDTLYIGARFGGQSMWMSDSAGVHWTKILPVEVALPLWNGDANIARIATLPDVAHHVIATSVGGWTGFGEDSGVIEGQLVGDTWQWTAHLPMPGMDNQQELAVLDAQTWLVVSNPLTATSGGWITHDAGTTFEQLDNYVALGGFQLYRAADGTLYRPAYTGLLRSTDNGATWIDVFAGLGLGGTRSLIGDGTTLYASSSVPDGDPVVRLFTAPEHFGDRDWMRAGNPTTLSISRFIRDELRGVLYTLTGDGSMSRTKQ